uniref:DC1 domain-containing protein n=1 Tax=Leersia perrieri TaxID=77586 RepID=A0A0D9X7P8_9ORYZ
MKVKVEMKDSPAPAEICNHPFHPSHKLKLVTAAADPDAAGKFVCDGCKEKGGVGCPRYTCEDASCDFDLHASCALAPDVLPEHPLFKGSAFVLLHEPPPPTPTDDPGLITVCDACGDEVCGFVYHCFDGDLDIHPCCANLPDRVVALDGVVFELCHGRTAPRRCLLCTGKKSRRRCRRKYWTYSNNDLDDGEAVHLHVACVKKMAYENSSAAGSSSSHWNMQVTRALVQTGALSLKKKGKSRSAFQKFVKIVVFVLRVVVGVLFGDPTALAVAVVGLVFPNG